MRGGDGAEVIYALRNNDKLSKLILNELEKEGQNIRKAYQRRLPSDMSKDYYFMQRNTGNTESITIEYGFLDGNGDDINQLKNNWKKYAEAVVRAIMQYIGLPYYDDKIDYEYIVKSGDSLWSIAKKFNTTVDEIKLANNLSSNLLTINQRLIIPDSNLNNIINYEVKRGDTLYNIAKMYNTTVEKIMSDNNLSSNLLNIGDILSISVNSLNDSKKYIVKSGDTLYKIAKSNNISISDLMKKNNLSSTILSIGQLLLI